MDTISTMNLKEFFEENPRAALGFSGGVDSAFLLYAAKKYGCDITPYFVKTQFQPRFELEDARRLCSELKIPLTVIEHDVLAHEDVAQNPANRCYFCKKVIFGLIQERAAADGHTLLIDGTNASDDADDRPGMKAIRELSVRSPLRECGLTKADVRRLSKEAGLFTHDKPSYACLATRIAAGVRIDAEALEHIERSEDLLSALGFSDFRVRVFHGAARIQLPEGQFARAAEQHKEIYERLLPYFNDIMLDMKSR